MTGLLLPLSSEHLSSPFLCHMAVASGLVLILGETFSLLAVGRVSAVGSSHMPFLRLGIFPLLTICQRFVVVCLFVNHESASEFLKSFFCIHWDNILGFLSLWMRLDCVDGFSEAKPIFHSLTLMCWSSIYCWIRSVGILLRIFASWSISVVVTGGCSQLLVLLWLGLGKFPSPLLNPLDLGPSFKLWVMIDLSIKTGFGCFSPWRSYWCQYRIACWAHSQCLMSHLVFSGTFLLVITK